MDDRTNLERLRDWLSGSGPPLSEEQGAAASAALENMLSKTGGPLGMRFPKATLQKRLTEAFAEHDSDSDVTASDL